MGLQAPLAVAPDMGKLRLVTPILISDRAEDDIDDETLEQLTKFGLGRDEILRQILSKTHSALATLYYLLLNNTVTKRRLAMKGRKSLKSQRHDVVSKQFGNNGSTPTQVQPVQQQAAQGLGSGMTRPRSASATRPSSHRYSGKV